MKNRCSCKARLEHEQRFLLINLVLTWETVSIRGDNTAQRRGSREIKGGEAISVEAKKGMLVEN